MPIFYLEKSQVQKNNAKIINFVSKNKGLIIAAVLPLLFWIGIFSVWFITNNNNQKSNQLIIKKNSTSQNGANINQILSLASNQIDTDKDGLSDWEESLYGTDLNSPDSDGDGYLDGEEVISKRDPLKRGPDDFLSTDITINTNNSTDNISKLIIENYVKILQEQGSSDLTLDQLNDLLDKSLNDEESIKFNEALKSELYYFIPANLDNNISASKDNSEKNIKKYWTEMNKSLDKLISSTPSYDFFQTISFSMQTKDYKKLDDFIRYYKTGYENVKMITVPSSLIDNHKNILTVFYKHWKITEAIKDYEKDSLRALLAINELTKITQQTLNK